MTDKKKIAKGPVIRIDDYIAKVGNDINKSDKVVAALSNMITEHPKARFFVERKGIQYFRVD
jgi:hypothetical protein